MADQESFLTMEEVAEHYRTTKASVQWWRQTGFGPRGTKVGRRVLYPISEILRFDAAVRAEVSGPVPGAE